MRDDRQDDGSQEPAAGTGEFAPGGTVTPFPGTARVRPPAARPGRAPQAPFRLAERHHNLPLQLTSFVGREQTLAEVRRLLGTTRLLTLTGAPGIGKTRLALQLAGEALEAYADGVWLVELAPLADPTLVPQAIAAVLGVQEGAGRPLLASLADALRARRLLLVLDNCEHLVAACATVADHLLRTCPELTIVATSREALGIAGETTWLVPTLDLPAPPRAGDSVGASDPRRSEAVQLFVERAQAAQPAFALSERNAVAVGQVCRRLDGIPLALELAAARVRALSVEQLAQRLDDQLRLLTGGSRAALPRQQTLRAAVDWSYALLPEPERILLRRLAVFAGGWTLPAAEAVCGGAGLEAADVFPLLVDLVDKSLVVAEPEEAEPRYRLLETLRQYGVERLREADEALAVRTRHLEWFAGLADEMEQGLRGPDQLTWLARLEREHDNVRTALAWSQTEPGNADAGLRLVAGMWQFWYMRTLFDEARRWLQPALSIAGGESIPARGKVLWCAGALALANGQYDTAEGLLRESLAHHQALGSRRGEAEAVAGLGFLAFSQGHYKQAATLLTEGLAQLRDVGYPFDVAITLGALGLVAQAQEDYARAADLYEQQLALFQEQGDQHGAAWASQYLGLVAQAQRDHVRAGELYRQALALRRTLGDAGGIAGSLEGLAEVAWALDQPERAAWLFGVAAALRDAIGFPLFPNERINQERTLAALRARLDEEALRLALAGGRAMRLEEAIDFALAPDDTRPVVSAAPAAPSKEPATANLSMPLSPRECEVALLVARGLTNRQIAGELVITEWTADSHVRHILSKLGVRSRAQVAAWATEQGLVPPTAP